MATSARDQRFLLILIVSLVAGFCNLGTSDAQIFTTEDRDSILKFMNVFMNFLDMETENSTSSTVAPTSNATSTILPSGNSTESSTESSSESSSSTASNSTISTSSSTVSANSTATTSEATTSSEATSTTGRRRICFKRFCYKFSNDKGYIV
ncbi:hypothetical protein KR018_008123 [Drosophila ironensis]|nr:hypothetical protein KR018_008123 [Drosophila ironensis]